MGKKSTYSKLLLNPLWQKKRVEILQRDNFTCVLCADINTTLHVHHDKYVGKPWDIPSDQLRTLCEHCHSVVHALPGLYVVKVHKQISFNTKCWEIVATTTISVVFLYLFFAKDADEGAKTEIIKVLTELKPAA